MSELIFTQFVNGSIDDPDEKKIQVDPFLVQIKYRLDGQTYQISKKDIPGESDEKIDDATRHKSDWLILVYILGNTMCITPDEQHLGLSITQLLRQQKPLNG